MLNGSVLLSVRMVYGYFVMKIFSLVFYICHNIQEFQSYVTYKDPFKIGLLSEAKVIIYL